jgi:hypothetical protein
VEHYSSLFGDPDLLRSFSAFATPVPGQSPFRDLLNPYLNLPTPRDPNAFYYKPDRPNAPVAEFSLECRQWRHGVEPAVFAGQISVGSDAEMISGALECHIYAGNASQPAVKLVPVQITVKHVKAFATAKELVERLARSIFA